MKNGIRMTVLVSLLLLSTVYVSAQVSIGLRDNQYVTVGYTYKQSWNVKLEHSIFSQKFSTQYVRFMLGYKHRWNRVSVNAQPYYGTIYRGDFHNAGIMLNGRWQVLKRWNVECTLNPHYDSEYDYTTCVLFGTGLHLYKALSAVLQYSTIPEYRMKEKRIKAGLHFAVDKLRVFPMLSIPVDGSGKHVRVLCGFEYEF